MKVISFYNEKGGVGKSTIIINTAIELAKHQKKVLLIDCDPQANTTAFFVKRSGKNYDELKPFLEQESVNVVI